MRKVKGLDKSTIVGRSPRYLIVGGDYEDAAMKALAVVNPQTTADVNVNAGRFTLIVEPRITDKRWFLVADPAQLPCLVRATLASAPGVQVQRQESWNTLGVSFRGWLDVAFAATDWRGMSRNRGQVAALP